MFGVVCSANNASILIECTGSAKWCENNNEDDDDADDDVGDDNHEDYAEGFFCTFAFQVQADFDADAINVIRQPLGQIHSLDSSMKIMTKHC